MFTIRARIIRNEAVFNREMLDKLEINDNYNQLIFFPPTLHKPLIINWVGSL